MFRIALGLVLGGAVVGYLGFEEYKVGAGASTVPIRVELSALEVGGELPDNHLEVGPHWAIFPAWVGWGDQDSEQLDHIYYPIVSESHPFNQAWDDLLARYGDQEIPEAEIPQLSSLAVLVKSKRYDRESAVPEQWEEVDSITGLVVNDIDSLKSDEEELIRETFPALSLDGVLVLEQDRAPKSASSSLGIVALGGLLMLGGAGLMSRQFL